MTVKQVSKVYAKYEQVVEAFSDNPHLSRGSGKGFGAGALKAKGKIFAMISSKGKFVVKLPKERVAELVTSGQGEPFETGRGRVMKEWVVMMSERTPWVRLAKEACRFVSGGND
jgi:hypothetical protein